MPDVPVLEKDLPRAANAAEDALPPADPALATVAVVGLGYVGLPVAVEFGKLRNTVGYDLSSKKVWRLKQHHDATGELSAEELRAAAHLAVTDDPERIREADFVIIAVPTPVNDARQPDFTPLESASRIVGKHLKAGATVIYESTVYPGTTEEICVPILERCSGMRWKQDFHVGYSPERINPGDKEHTFTKIMKVVSGDDAETLEKVASLYASVVKAGVFRASSIKVAEAAKVIENTQRDLNIAFVNELAIIFDRLGIETHEVLQAAGTKWNFLPFRPGLVGGHCIGVDPYYLIQKAQSAGYYPDILLACRRINDGMGAHIAAEVIKLMIQRGMAVSGARILLLGLTFKENCPDLRNTRVREIVDELSACHAAVDVHDPWADPDECERECGFRPLTEPRPRAYDAIVIAVGHSQYHQWGVAGIRAFAKPNAVIYDVKYVLPADAVDGRL